MTDENRKEKIKGCPVDDSSCFPDYEKRQTEYSVGYNGTTNDLYYTKTNVTRFDLNHPIYKLYLEICKEVVKFYSDKETKPSMPLKQIFGLSLELKFILEKYERNEIYPIPSNKIATLINCYDHFFNRKFMKIRNGDDPYFQFNKLIDIKARLTAAFNSEVAYKIVYNYLNARGARYPLIFSITEIIYQYTDIYFTTRELSRIIYNKETTFKDLLGTNTYDIQKSLNPLWRLEYYIFNLKIRERLGFDINLNTLINIKQDCIKEIRKHIYKNFNIINPFGFKMIWECLYALSDARGESEPISIQDLSEMIAPLDYKYKRQYLNKRIEDYGFDFYSYIAEDLLNFIAPHVPRNHKVIKCIQDYLVTIRNKSLIDIEAIYNKPMMPIRTTKKLSNLQRNFMTEIVWRLSCERDWMTGGKIPREWAALHHIRHDPATGLTIHSDNRLINFACLTINDYIDNNIRVERNWSRWEKKFIITWDYLPKGMAPPHWSEDNQRNFMRERKSKNHLDEWIIKFEEYKNF